VALSQKPDKLWREVRRAIDDRDDVLKGFDKAIRRMHGSGYGSETDGEETTVNHAVAWLSVMLPKMIHRNPKSIVRTRRAIDGQQSEVEQAADSIQAFLNVWVKSVGLAKTLKLCARDYSFHWCAAIVTRRKHAGDPTQDTETERWLPEVQRVPLWRLVIDPYCECLEQARYVGHVWHADKEDLVEIAKNADEDDGWVLEAIEASEPGESSVLNDERDENSRTVDREELVCLDLWVPEKLHDEQVGPEDGFHGTILTMSMNAEEEKLAFIRKPRPYYGPPCGPYAVGGYLNVPKKVWPLGPLAVTHGHEDLLRRMTDHANKACAEYRKVMFVPMGTGAEEAAKKAAVGNNIIIPVRGLASDAAPVTLEIGGLTDQQIKQMSHAERQLSLMSGLDAAQQGEVSGDGTATEHAIADSAMQTRSGHIVDNFHEFVNAILKKSAWYGFHDEQVRLELSEDIEGLEGMESPEFVGGPGGLDSRAFDAMSIDIEAMSMERTSDALHQRRMLQAMQIMVQLAPVIRQFPEWKWKQILGFLGDALNIPELDSMVDFDMASQLMNVPVGGQEQQPAIGIETGFGNDTREAREVVGRIAGAASGVQGVA
jgi:hypothetical protein